MAGLKELRNRLDSIKSTQKITSAMKLVAASRLRKAQILLERSRGYSDILSLSIRRILAAIREEETEKNIRYMLPGLLQQKPGAQNYLLLVFASDRGLCGSYNQNVGKAANKRIAELESAGKNVRIICYGKKAFDMMKKKHAEKIIEHNPSAGARGFSYAEAVETADKIINTCRQGGCDVCELVYSRFHSALSREMDVLQVYPLESGTRQADDSSENLTRIGNAYYDYYPDKIALLEALLPKLFTDMVFNAMANAQASEHGARMAAMDNATRNAKDMIGSLTLKYNSIRQSAITTELTEIISGAEAL